MKSWFRVALVMSGLLVGATGDKWLMTQAPLAVAHADAPNEQQRIAMIAKPSVVRVFGVYLATYQVGRNSFPVSIGGTGSGFFITGDGFIATNAHVVQEIAGGDDKAKKALLSTLYRQLDQRFPELRRLSEAELNEILAGIKLTEFKKLSYVVLPNGDKLDYEIRQYGEPGKGQDSAIIKVKTSAAPTLPVGDSSKVQVADRIVVIGYPGVADFKALLDERSQLEASVTDGSIAALKRSADGHPILQITAPITHGNSGGPALDNHGNVIGLATFGNEGEVQGFNFLVGAATLRAQVDALSLTLTPSTTATLWQQGLELYWDNQYGKAKATFEQVKGGFPAHSEAPNLIAAADEAIKAGKEKKVAPPDDNTGIIVGAAGGVLGLGLLGLFLMRRKKPQATLAYGQAHGPAPGQAPGHAYGPHGYAPAPGYGQQPVSPYGPGANVPVGASANVGPRVMPQPGMPNSPGFGHPAQMSASPLAPSPMAPSPLAPRVPSPLAPAQQAQVPQAAGGIAPVAKTMAIQSNTVADTAFGSAAFGSLVCVRGPLAGQKFALPPTGILIGRQPGVAQIVINDARASAKHVWIGPENGVMVCIDQGTTNGTFVNDVSLGRISKRQLRDGDIVIVSEPDVLSLQIRFS